MYIEYNYLATQTILVISNNKTFYWFAVNAKHGAARHGLSFRADGGQEGEHASEVGEEVAGEAWWEGEVRGKCSVQTPHRAEPGGPQHAADRQGIKRRVQRAECTVALEYSSGNCLWVQVKIVIQ